MKLNVSVCLLVAFFFLGLFRPTKSKTVIQFPNGETKQSVLGKASVESIISRKRLPRYARHRKAKPSVHCPRNQNGFFAHEDPHICDEFYYCEGGKYHKHVCPAGYVYDVNMYECTFPDEAKKKKCFSQGHTLRKPTA